MELEKVARQAFHSFKNLFVQINQKSGVQLISLFISCSNLLAVLWGTALDENEKLRILKTTLRCLLGQKLVAS